MLGEQRLAWLRNLSRTQQHGSIALVHARPEDLWRAPTSEASEAELTSAYGPLTGDVIVYGHIHTPYVRSTGGRIIANSGSVGLPYDGDRRASYLLLDGGKPFIRRVEYAVDKELQSLAHCGLPHAEWIAKSLAAPGLKCHKCIFTRDHAAR